MKRSTAIWILAAHVACSFSPEEEGLPETAVTQWTDKTELFMEYEALVAGRETRFAVHLTDLRSFEPIGTGTATLELESESGRVERFEGPTPSRPGIFRVVANVPEAGRYRMILRVAEPEDAHNLGDVIVYSNVSEVYQGDTHDPAQSDDHTHEAEVPAEPTVSFLKEQQWNTQFRTGTVQSRSLHASVKIPAQVQARTGGEARVVSPLAGRIVLEGDAPAPGSPVLKGQVLARVSPRVMQPEDWASLELIVAEAKAEMELARRTRERMERLLEAKAVPARRLDEARQREAVAVARLESTDKRRRQFEDTRLSGGGVQDEAFIVLSSPISGVLVKSRATQGEAIEQGEELFVVVDPSVVYVVGAIPESEAARLRSPKGVEIQIPGREEPLVIDSQKHRLLSVGTAVDAISRTVPIVYQIDNVDGSLLVGQAVSLVLFTEEVLSVPAVPATALVDEGNRFVVFAQVDGESFARRLVETGIRAGGFVQVLAGLQEGERVVTEGAYEVRLASLSGQIPAEGHVH